MVYVPKMENDLPRSHSLFIHVVGGDGVGIKVKILVRDGRNVKLGWIESQKT